MNLLRFPRLWLAASLFLFFANTLPAQTARTPRETALHFLQENPAQFGLEKTDVSDVRVVREYFSKNNGVTHVWAQQQHLGIPVFNGLFGLHVKSDGSVLHLAHRFVPNLAAKVNTTLPSLAAAKAVELAAANLGFIGFPAPSLRQEINERNFVFEGGSVSKKEIPVSICYDLQNGGSVRLAWTLVIADATSSDVWNMRVDAQTGLILSKFNQTIYCQAGHAHRTDDVEPCAAIEPTTNNEQRTTINEQQATTSAADSYNVFPLPVESPAHGARQIMVSPADPQASPFGWHDTNGAPGAEYTYTRGNNVWAFDDRNDDNVGTAAESAQGGASLNFDFPFNPNGEPLDNLNAAVTNLFYTSNMMHDIAYLYGFDEQAGNFQQNNYGNGGLGNDAIQANAIDGFALSNPLANDAVFFPEPDGSPGRMQMYVWTRGGGQLLRVNSPDPVEGTYTVTLAAESPNPFGGNITDVPITGDVVAINDGSAYPTLGCEQTQQNLTGKIAMVDRGDCQYSLKAYYAQQAGAVGCVVCNVYETLSNMGAGAFANQVTIPVVMLKKSDCDKLRPYLGNGLNISLVRPPAVGPDLLDGDFDNGIIAHEYTHGISHRLTGDGSTTCLSNAEQMGEGWSDFFALATSARAGDVAEQRRGLGTYVLRQSNDDVGIRRYPYSTDMSINPLTYGFVAETPGVLQVHPRGEVWAAVCWDLYWAMVEKYGFDANIKNTNSGNGRAIQLVMDGLKLQPCSPGFMDGRDAIMAADVLNYNGADTCLISSVFARRGMGYFANQGSSFSAGDGAENFDPIPTCVKELKIKKETSTPLIEPGENAEFAITVTNHKDEAVANVVVTDEVPNGLSFVSASNGGTYSNGIVTWNLGAIPSGQIFKVNYTTQSADQVGSLRYFHDMMEDAVDWIPQNLVTGGTESFFLQSNVVKTGTVAWKAEVPPTESDFTLEYILPITVSGAQPVLRFWHQYSTQTGFDAGIVEIQKPDEGLTWYPFPAGRVFRNPYPAKIDYLTFAIPNVNGFSGESGGWVQSYFDLSDYAGQKITIRFRVGSNDDGTISLPTGFWYVDEVEVMDMLNFDGSACVTSAGGDQACAKAASRGVIVQPGTVGAEEPGAGQLSMQVQPNPASDFLHIALGPALSGPVQIQLVGMDGRRVLRRDMEGLSEGQIITLDVQGVPAGVYIVRLENGAGSSVRKVVVR